MFYFKFISQCSGDTRERSLVFINLAKGFLIDLQHSA